MPTPTHGANDDHDRDAFDAATQAHFQGDPLPWAVYLLIDPTRPPTSHPGGEVFYVGIALSGRHFQDLGAPEALPDREVDARERVKAIMDAGQTPLVEVLANALTDRGREDRAEAARDALILTLNPPVLNARMASCFERWDGRTASRLQSAPAARAPDDVQVLVAEVTEPGQFGTVQGLLDASADALFETFSSWPRSQVHKASALNRAASEARVLWLLVAGTTLFPGLVPPGLILGARLLGEAEDKGPGTLLLAGLTGPESDALQRLLVGAVIPIPASPAEGRHALYWFDRTLYDES
ncbi:MULTISPECIES: hypothetical protein [Nostocoides]